LLRPLESAWSKVLAGQEITLTEHRGNPQLAQSIYEIKYRPLRNQEGLQIGAFQFASDISERLRDQARLAQAQAALIQSQKLEAMGQLTGGVAHDFNNLLTPIIGSMDLLRRRGVGGVREQRLISAGLESAQRAKVLVQRLLAFAKRQPLQSAVIDVGALIKGLTDLVSSTIGPQVALQIDVAAGPLHAKADANQLEMAILNLAVNARDAINGTGAIKIAVSSRILRTGEVADLAPGRYLHLLVADTGHGMDATTLARAVEPFFSTKGVGQGTGLGLSMAHGLACQLGGTLTLASQLGRGTEVSIWLPESTETRLAEETAAMPPPSFSAGIALLVDDEELIRLSTADMLSDLGFKVHEVPSAEAALEAISAGLEADLLITDHLMPGITGVQLAHIVKSRTPHTRVLVISGFAEIEGIEPSLARLTKPFVQSDLEAALAELQQR
jgi:signal transduction histidine kinase/CheY-like chemotaxis protein